MKMKSIAKAAAMLSMAVSYNAFAGGCDDTNFAAWDTFREDVAGMLDAVAPGMETTACKAAFTPTANEAERSLLRDSSPACESSFRQRFLLNIDNWGTMGNVQRLKVHNAQCVTAQNGGAVACANTGVIQFRLQGNNGQNIMRSFVTDEGPATAADNRRKFDIPVNSGDQAFEYQWIRASGPGAADGVFRLWWNGNTVEASPDVEFTDMQNWNYCIDRVSLGMVSTNSFISSNQAGNALFIDEYESRRQTAIGVQ
jgi:hypothetical protein